MTRNDKNRAYWKKNLQYLGTLLAVWFIVSYGCAILFVNHLDKIKIGRVFVSVSGSHNKDQFMSLSC